MAKAIYERKSDANTCWEIAYKKYGTPQRSFRNWFVPLFRFMLEGETFKGAVPQSLTRYYLERIFEDYGKDALGNALRSYRGTIDYYELERGENKPGDSAIYEEFTKLLRDVESIDRFTIINELDETETPDVEGLRISVFVNVLRDDLRVHSRIEMHLLRPLVEKFLKTEER